MWDSYVGRDTGTYRVGDCGNHVVWEKYYLGEWEQGECPQLK